MVAALPGFARIRELRLAIRNAADDPTRVLNLKRPYGLPLREMWAGEVLFAPLSRLNADAFDAFLAGLDGRTTPFTIPLTAGFAGQPAVRTASLLSVPARQANTISINLSPTTGAIAAGTLMSVGSPANATYQVFEVVTSVLAAATVVLTVAPRVRWLFSIGDPVALGNVLGKFTLADDGQGASREITHGLATLNVLEALA